MNNDIRIIDEPDYGNGYFDFVKDKSERDFLRSAHKAITLCELWHWLRIYKPIKDKGFMYYQAAELDKLQEQMSKDPINDLHSGSSYGFIMREMEYIAKNGYDNYRNTFY
jgi:hypothetical protein